jgi:hypothetical protein
MAPFASLRVTRGPSPARVVFRVSYTAAGSRAGSIRTALILNAAILA